LNSTDVFVIGGGPAGLAAAIAARQQGFQVMVADGGQPPIDKACGEGLMPDGVAALQRLGISVAKEDSYPLLGVRFLSSGMIADAPFPDMGRGLGVRRTTLHGIMVERARSLGIDLQWKTVVTGISGNNVDLPGRCVRAKWIIGADGGNSRVRRWVGLDRRQRRGFRYAFRRHYRIEPWADRMEVYWGPRSQAYVAPVGEDCVCVAVASHDPHLRLDGAMPGFPELHARLRCAETVSVEKGALTATCRLNRICRGNVALVGDASGTVDAITGEGLCMAFNQAIVLANCLRSGDLRDYQREHRRMSLRPSLMARLMLTLDGNPGLQRRTLRVFRNRPDVFRRLVALHVGVPSPLHLAVDSFTLGWGLLTS
jgi:flavin-dependent dehydrogenase